MMERFSLRMEPGDEELWLALRDCPRQFTAEDLARAANVGEAKAQHYLTLLVRNGSAFVQGPTTDGKLIYSCIRLASSPMVFNGRGQPAREFEIRRALWTAARMNKRAISVSSLFRLVREHHAVQRSEVARFIERLAAAGYFVPLDGQTQDGEPEFMLRPSMNTGPLPPRLCEATLVYDINTRSFFGQGIAHQVSLLGAAA